MSMPSLSDYRLREHTFPLLRSFCNTSSAAVTTRKCKNVEVKIFLYARALSQPVKSMLIGIVETIE